MKAKIGFVINRTGDVDGDDVKLEILTAYPEKFAERYDLTLFSDELIYPNEIPDDVKFYAYGEFDKDGMVEGSIKLYHESAKEMASEHYEARKTAINVKHSNLRDLVAEELKCSITEIGRRLFEMDMDIEKYAEENKITPTLRRKSFLILLGG